MPPNKKVLFLYSHVQPFLLAGINRLIANYDAQVLLVCWPTADIAPFDLAENDSLSYRYKTPDNKKEIESAIFDFDPDIVYNVGWMDKDYLRWCRRFARAGKINIMAMDTQWRGDLRQWINCLLGSMLYRSIFKYAWVPGPLQFKYARKLGFDERRILNNLYAPDTELFRKAYERFYPFKSKHYPKTFLYTGRLVEHKFGPLLRAFTMLTDHERNGWQLMVVGKGPMEQALGMGSGAIIYKGFLQQHELAELAGDAGVFCLLSTEEPWGMVIQEFAAAGLPVLASKQCGAAHTFVKEGETGYIVDGNDIKQVKDALLKMIGTADNKLLEMGDCSMQIATSVNSDTWADELMSVL